jgi:beta-N-acetylhexosaminidase
VVITDALEMKGAALIAGGVPKAAVRALDAGADLLCVGAKVDAALIESVAREIVGAVGDGRLTLARLEQAYTRTSDLAKWTLTARTGIDASPGLGVDAARRAVRVEGSLAELGGPLVVRLISGHSIAEGRVPWGLEPHLNGVEHVSVVAASASAAELVARAGSRPIIVVGRRVGAGAASRSLIERLAAAHPVGVVEMGWPSSWRPAGVRAFVLSYGASFANGRAVAALFPAPLSA